MKGVQLHINILPHCKVEPIPIDLDHYHKQPKHLLELRKMEALQVSFLVFPLPIISWV